MAPESSVSPATRAVLFSSDLQVEIFKALKDKTRTAANCALVCKGWTENALNHAWHMVTSFRQIFNILAPLTPPESSRDNGFDFLRPIQAEDRLRLNYYSRRVRHLDVPPLGVDNDRRDLPCDFAFIELLASSDGPTILPNLVKMFSYSCGAVLRRIIAPFLCPGLEDLTLVWAEDESKPELFRFLEDVESRSPHLRKLFLGLPEDSTMALEPVSQFVSNQASLEEFCQSGIPPLSLLSAVPGLPKLKYLSLSLVGADNIQSINCTPCRTGVCFSSLQRLSLETTSSNAATFISNHPSFSKLTEIAIYSYEANDSNTVEDFHRLFVVVSKLCPHLEVLETFWYGTTNRINDINEHPPVICDTFSPLASCRRLRALSLLVGPLRLDSKELVDLLARFPRLEIFSLESSLPYTFPPSPTLQVLHQIAEVQPDLRRLGLQLTDDSAVSEQLFLDTSAPFRRLEELEVGFCQVADADRAALYLGHILPPGCKISTRHYGHDGKQWETVRSRIPFFAALVSQYRCKLREERSASHQKLASCRCNATEKGQ